MMKKKTVLEGNGQDLASVSDPNEDYFDIQALVDYLESQRHWYSLVADLVSGMVPYHLVYSIGEDDCIENA